MIDHSYVVSRPVFERVVLYVDDHAKFSFTFHNTMIIIDEQNMGFFHSRNALNGSWSDKLAKIETLLELNTELRNSHVDVAARQIMEEYDKYLLEKAEDARNERGDVHVAY